jgi:hypothetical protein
MKIIANNINNSVDHATPTHNMKRSISAQGPIVLKLEFLLKYRVWQNHSKFLAKITTNSDGKIFFGPATNAPIIAKRDFIQDNPVRFKKAYTEFYTTMFNAFTEAHAAGIRTPFDLPANMPDFVMPVVPIRRASAKSPNRASPKKASHKKARASSAAKAAMQDQEEDQREDQGEYNSDSDSADD